MSESISTVAPSLSNASTNSLLDASLSWFGQALRDGNADITAAFFTLEPRAQFLALDVLRSSVRAALQIADFDSSAFGTATAAHYRSWLACDEELATFGEVPQSHRR